MFKERLIERFKEEFGAPDRVTSKVTAFEVSPSLGVVVQTDQPNKEDAAFVWLPYPPDEQSIPEIALEYAAESGRHSNTYASAGLERDKPALKLILRTEQELNEVVAYIHAFKSFMPLPQVKASEIESQKSSSESITPINASAMPKVSDLKPRREAIPRAVQREVWQRDGGKCVECGTREKLCFDHIVPFSRGGSNTIRNLQLLCERCNLSKGNRI